MATIGTWTAETNVTELQDTANRTNSTGTLSCKLTLSGGGNAGTYQDITTVAAKYYRLRFYYKNTSDDFAQIKVTDDRTGTEADIIAATDLADSTSWSSAQDYFFQAVSTLTTIYIRGKNDGDIVWFDDVSVMEVDITGVNTAGTIITGYNRAHDRRKGCAAIGALITCEDQTARFCINGDVPTQEASSEPQNGIELAAASSIYIRGEAAVRNFSVVDGTSGSATKIEVTCFFQ